MDRDFVSFSVKFLNSRIVGVLVGYEVGGLDLTSVWILTPIVENFFVQFDVVNVDGIVESDGYHLWNLTWLQITWDGSSVG